MIQMWHWHPEEKLRTATKMRECRIIFYGDQGNKEHELLSRRFYRLFGKFATNKGQVEFRMPSREFLIAQDKGSLFWLGHDAIRWAKEDPQRVFFYNATDWAFRPDSAGAVGMPAPLRAPNSCAREKAISRQAVAPRLRAAGDAAAGRKETIRSGKPSRRSALC